MRYQYIPDWDHLSPLYFVTVGITYISILKLSVFFAGPVFGDVPFITASSMNARPSTVFCVLYILCIYNIYLIFI